MAELTCSRLQDSITAKSSADGNRQRLWTLIQGDPVVVRAPDFRMTCVLLKTGNWGGHANEVASTDALPIAGQESEDWTAYRRTEKYRSALVRAAVPRTVRVDHTASPRRGGVPR